MSEQLSGKYLLITEDGKIWTQDSIGEDYIMAFKSGAIEIIDMISRCRLWENDKDELVWKILDKFEDSGGQNMEKDIKAG